MNNVRLAINTTRAAIGALNDYRERKTAEAYEALSDVAENYTLAELAEMGQEKGRAIIDDRRDSAAKVAENARVRLEKAREEAASAGATATTAGTAKFADFRKESEKKSKQLAKKANKRAVKAGLKKAPKKKCGKLSATALLVAVLGAIGAAVYWFMFRPEKANTVPPRVEEHTAEGSRLVYSSVTPTDTEVDADFLEDLDKQLAEHQAQDADVAEQTQAINDGEFADDAIDEALDKANVAELDSLEDQAEEAEKEFDEKQ
ncbi:hypothetical protein WG915_07475 [Corynebacterium sp. H128]|uniref:hypothetical protein n=1 Tax=unclassified Corynebacterium TaxID=2624378 RepID=UPI003095A6C5